MAPLLLWLAAAVGCRGAAAGAGRDISALVQGSVRAHRAGAGAEEEDELQVGRSASEQAAQEGQTVGDSVKQTSLGPMAYSRLGPVVGKAHDHFITFLGIPYVEKPETFEVAQPKKSWAPDTYDAKDFQKACIGAGTGELEDEDCLHVNVWVPKGGHKDMPVIVYFHGGINQHGSGSEWLRRGDGIANSTSYPTIFVNFNFRLGIFGWITLKDSNISSNLGLLDQQAALRWVQGNIAAFGGDPTRVTLQGQSEGCGIILVHMVAPGSRGLFHRCVFHSPPADFFSRHVNVDHTNFMIDNMGCKRPKAWSTVRCLKRKKEARLWHADFVSEELSRNVGSPSFTANLLRLANFALKSKHKGEIPGELGWHAVIDNETLFGEPRDLIRQGRFHKVPVLLVVSRNESKGVIPSSIDAGKQVALGFFLGNQTGVVEILYAKTLKNQGIQIESVSSLMDQMVTDKVWTCDIRSLAAAITTGGGRAYVGMFAHEPKYAPVGTQTSPECAYGATCHADEMMYIMTHGLAYERKPELKGELKFGEQYRDSVLAFVAGNDTGHPWVPYNAETQIMTFYKANGTFQVPRYRKEQCDVLDRYMGPSLPEIMHKSASLVQ